MNCLYSSLTAVHQGERCVCLWTQGSPSPVFWAHLMPQLLAPQQPAEPKYLHNEAGGRLPLKEHLLLPLVGAQEFLLGAQAVTAIDDDEDVGVCPSSKDITGVESDLVRNNWGWGTEGKPEGM